MLTPERTRRLAWGQDAEVGAGVGVRAAGPIGLVGAGTSTGAENDAGASGSGMPSSWTGATQLWPVACRGCGLWPVAPVAVSG